KTPQALHVHLLPFVEQQPLYQVIQGGGKGDNFVLPVFVSPQDATTGDAVGIQNYAGNLRVFSESGFKTKFDAAMPALMAVEPGRTRFVGITDGTSNTLAFATKLGVCGEGGSRYAAAVNTRFAAFHGQNPAKKSAHPSDPTATFQLNPAAKECL